MIFPDRPALDVVRDYLAEVLRLVESPAPFHILAHVDYAVRYWPAAAGPFGPVAVEDELRAVLRALAASGRALEINTKLPLAPQIVALVGGQRRRAGVVRQRRAPAGPGRPRLRGGRRRRRGRRLPPRPRPGRPVVAAGRR